MTRGFDLSRPVLLAVAALLAVMIVLPVGWLLVVSLTAKEGGITLANFVALFTDPTFVDPLVTTLDHRLLGERDLLPGRGAAGLAGGAHRHAARRAPSARWSMASLVTPPFVGAIAWEMLAAPNSGLLNQLWRMLSGMPSDEALFDIYSLTGLIFVISCYTFPYVFILVANALDRMPGELEDASSMLGAKTWQTARLITVPLALPALLAGALVAFLQALNLFGSPAILAIPAGFHTLTTRIWSLFQFPPKPELAAAASVPLLVLTVLLLRAQAMALGRRGYAVLGGKYGAPRQIRLGWLRMAGRGAGAVRPRHAAVPALRRAVQLRLLARGLAHRRAGDDHAAQCALHLPRAQLDDAGAQEHLPACHRFGHAGRAAGAADRLHRGAQGGARLSRAGLPRHRAARHSGHRAGRRPVPRLHAPAARALRHACGSC